MLTQKAVGVNTTFLVLTDNIMGVNTTFLVLTQKIMGVNTAFLVLTQKTVEVNTAFLVLTQKIFYFNPIYPTPKFFFRNSALQRNQTSTRGMYKSHKIGQKMNGRR